MLSIQTDPLDFKPALIRLQEKPPSPLGRRVLWATLAMLAGLLAWAALGQLDIVAVAEGKLVPETYLKIVQPADGGVVREILVKENQLVKAGQVLIRMDTSLSDSDTRALTADYQGKRLALRRIEAQLSDAPFAGTAEDPPALFNQVNAQYLANRQAYASALAQETALLDKAKHDLGANHEVRRKLQKTLPHYRDQEAAYAKLVSEGFAGQLMLTDKQRERIEKEQDLAAQESVIAAAEDTVRQEQSKIAQITADYRRQLEGERVATATELEKLRQELAKQRHRNALLELRAPQDGVVKDLATHTAGTVTSPGTILLTVVPSTERLRAEVWLKNDDAGFVHAGQQVKVKVAAYSFQKYGMLQGKVEQVSADASEQGGDTSQPQGKGQPWTYKTLVHLDRDQLEVDGQRHTLASGMQVAAEIHLGTRSVLEYLLSPVTRAFQESARER
jgi:HlyD family secretion protein